jgi:Outer membrane lipoprotein carrier protein LolA
MKTLLLLAVLLVALPLRSAELSAEWQTRIAALAAPVTLSTAFTESRFTPLKKKPVIVEGTVRIARERGLSLSYTQSRAPVVILDDRGLLLRHPDGREQSAPPAAETDLRVLHALFVFDLPTLEKSYALTPSESPDGSWSLTFTRLPDATVSYRELTLTGEAARLTSIRLLKTEKQKIEIRLEAPQINPSFTPDELARYFR